MEILSNKNWIEVRSDIPAVLLIFIKKNFREIIFGKYFYFIFLFLFKNFIPKTICIIVYFQNMYLFIYVVALYYSIKWTIFSNFLKFPFIKVEFVLPKPSRFLIKVSRLFFYKCLFYTDLSVMRMFRNLKLSSVNKCG